MVAQLAAVKRQSTDDLAAVRKELDEVRKGKEEDTEPSMIYSNKEYSVFGNLCKTTDGDNGECTRKTEQRCARCRPSALDDRQHKTETSDHNTDNT